MVECAWSVVRILFYIVLGFEDTMCRVEIWLFWIKFWTRTEFHFYFILCQFLFFTRRQTFQLGIIHVLFHQLRGGVLKCWPMMTWEEGIEENDDKGVGVGGSKWAIFWWRNIWMIPYFLFPRSGPHSTHEGNKTIVRNINYTLFTRRKLKSSLGLHKTFMIMTMIEKEQR